MMDDIKNLICVICDSTNFVLNDGFYFCTECGTQSKTIRDVEVDNIHSASKNTRVKINKEKRKKDETTTWESFNYLLHGLVEELISLGANEKLKLTVLQLWAAYLKTSEVAFFDNKRPQLPKLGPCFAERDAKILYNHQLTKKKARISSTKSDSVNLSSRQISRRKRKYAQAEYDKNSIASLSTSTMRLSTSTDTTGKAVRLSFTSTARRHFKRSIPKLHISKHEEDSDKELDCHSLKSNKKSIPKNVLEHQLCRRTIYIILYLALNLIEDDIQLSDMLRYQSEGHISTNTIQQFFPENVAEECVQVINSREFSSNRFVYLHISIRRGAAALCKYIGIKELKTPDLAKLATRYCHDLNLPIQLSIYCERLINLCPPNMKLRIERKESPCYEGRAIAYIIFILKLVFGLDGYKENCISNSARSVNEKLKNLNIPNTLFVWEDWVQYIEMRRLILAQVHLSTSIQSKSNISHKHYVEQIIAENAHTEETILKSKRSNFRNINKIFNDLYERTKCTSSDPQLLEFNATLTPHTDYFNVVSSNPSENICIPEFMNQSFLHKDLHSFINPFQLKKMLQNFSINLHVTKINNAMEVQYVEPFQHLDSVKTKKIYREVGVRKVDFDIDESEWLEEIKDKHNFTQKQVLVPLKQETKEVTDKLNKKKTLKNSNNSDNTKNEEVNKTEANNHSDELTIKCEPILEEEIIIEFPRRNLENSNIFGNLSDDDITNHEDLNENLKFVISNSEYYTLYGKMYSITIKKFNEIKKKFPPSFLWLLEFCSNYLQIDAEDIYQELLTIENQFLYNLEDLNKMKDILITNKSFPNPVLERYCEFYKQLW